MPISEYFHGHGDEVMRQMVAKHGKKAGEREFYATANARKQTAEQQAKHKGQIRAIRHLAGEE